MKPILPSTYFSILKKSPRFCSSFWGADQNFEEKTGVEVTEDNIINYLNNLPDGLKEKAEEYIRKALKQIRTKFRSAIETRLGWLPI